MDLQVENSLDDLFASVSATYFVSVFANMGIFFPFLRRTEALTLLLELHVVYELYFGYLSLWANIQLSVSEYHMWSFVIGLPHSE